MSQPVLDFVPIWTLILGVGVFLYVLLDGFDLGVGILYGFAPDRDSRNLVMNSIAPIWDGNETWLVLGGIALMAAFPLPSREALRPDAAAVRFRSRRARSPPRRDRAGSV
jgi:cytochrome d ubiquinol oxidase subunit II